MKIKSLSFFVACVAVFCGSVRAQQVDVETAKRIGAYYFNVATGSKAGVQDHDLTLVQQYDNPMLCVPAMYAFDVADGGFVVVSASRAVEPVMAYAPEGSLDPAALAPAAVAMLQSYSDIISEVQAAKAAPTAKIRGMWDALEEQTFSCDLSKAGVLVQTKWDQGSNTRPTYNIFCPTVDGNYCYAGCVAVAMGQIIKYWNYPERGGNDRSTTATWRFNNTTIKYNFMDDTNKFVYDSMTNTLSSYSAWNNKRAIGKLLFACGVAVKMGWGVDGSGAQSDDVPEALTKWFRYDEDASYAQRNGYTDAGWLSMLRSELVDHLRPVYYSGFSPSSGGRDAGHAWIIAGASAADDTKFYINWGWGGSSNGFYTLAPMTAIETAAGYKFTQSHAMVYKIYPKDLSIDAGAAAAVSPAYPNPASGHITIPVGLPNSAALGVYAMDGRMVDNIVVPAGTAEYRLDLRRYAPGTYVYRLNGNTYKFTVL